MKVLYRWGGDGRDLDTSDILPHEIWVLHTGWAVDPDSYHLREGPGEVPLDWQEFYRKVGHPEYAESVDTRELIKSIISFVPFIAPIVGFVVGGGLMVIGGGLCALSVLPSPLGLAVAAVGVVVLLATSATVVGSYVAPWLISSWPITMDENYALIEAYNRQLYGDPDDSSPTPAPDAARDGDTFTRKAAPLRAPSLAMSF